MNNVAIVISASQLIEKDTFQMTEFDDMVYMICTKKIAYLDIHLYLQKVTRGINKESTSKLIH